MGGVWGGGVGRGCERVWVRKEGGLNKALQVTCVDVPSCCAHHCDGIEQNTRTF